MTERQQLDLAIETIKRLTVNLSGSMTPHRVDQLRHEAQDVLTQLGHRPPQFSESYRPHSLLTLKEAAQQLGLSATTLRIQIRNQKLTALKLGRDWFVFDRDVQTYRELHGRAHAG